MMSNRTSLAEALASRYPELTDSQRQRLEAVILREIAAVLDWGESLAVTRPLPDVLTRRCWGR